MIVSNTCQQNPSQKSHSWRSCSCQETRQCCNVSPSVLYCRLLQKDKSHLFWMTLLWSGCDASAVPVTSPRRPFGGEDVSEPSCGSHLPQCAGWSCWRSCQPQRQKFHHTISEVGEISYIYPSQHKKGWTEAGMVRWIWMLFSVKKEKNPSPVVDYFLNNKIFHLKRDNMLPRGQLQ